MNMNLTIFKVEANCRKEFKFFMKLNAWNLAINTSFDASKFIGKSRSGSVHKNFMARIGKELVKAKAARGAKENLKQISHDTLILYGISGSCNKFFLER